MRYLALSYCERERERERERLKIVGSTSSENDSYKNKQKSFTTFYLFNNYRCFIKERIVEVSFNCYPYYT
jgi:hypothetical protein